MLLKKLTSTCTILLFTALTSLGQNKSQPMVWMEAWGKVNISEKVSALALIHHRIFLDKDQTYQDIYWLSGDYKFGKNVSIGGGLMYFTYHKAVGEGFEFVPETRPFQYIIYRPSIGKVKFRIRAMVEERYMSDVVNNEIDPLERFNMRYRFRVRANIPLVNKFSLELSNELLFNGQQLEAEVFGQNRARGLVCYKVTEKIGVSAGYLQWTVNTSKGIEQRPSAFFGANYKF